MEVNGYLEVNIDVSGTPWEEFYDHRDNKQNVLTTSILVQISQGNRYNSTILLSRLFCSVFPGISYSILFYF